MPAIPVDDLRRALQTLAERGRRRLSGDVEVVGVTGSVGKTGTVNMIARLLSYEGPTFVTTRNMNDRLGVMETLASTPSTSRHLVLEMAGGKPGQIDFTAGLAKPTVGVFMNVGFSHAVNFAGDRYAILKGKASMFGHLTGRKAAIVGREVLDYDAQREGYVGALGIDTLISIGDTEKDAVRVRSTSLQPTSTRAEIEVDGRVYTVVINESGRHYAVNAAYALATAFALGLDVQGAADNLVNYQAAVSRTQRLRVNVQGGGTIVEVIDDAWNASPTSFRALMEVLKLRTEPRKVLIFGDMLDLGERERELHEELSQDVLDAGVQRLITIGPLAGAVGARLSGSIEVTAFPTVKEAAQRASELVESGDLIALKGSHGVNLAHFLGALAPKAAHRRKAGPNWIVEHEQAT